MSQLSASVGSFSAALDAQKGVLAQADQLLAGLDSQLVATSSALQSFDNDLAGIEQGLQTSRTDVVALNAASEWGLLGTLTDLEPEQIAQFISSPSRSTSIWCSPSTPTGRRWPRFSRTCRCGSAPSCSW